MEMGSVPSVPLLSVPLLSRLSRFCPPFLSRFCPFLRFCQNGEPWVETGAVFFGQNTPIMTHDFGWVRMVPT